LHLRKEDNRRILAIYKVQEGLEKLASGDQHNARLIFRKAIKIDPKCEAPYYYYAKSYLKDKRDTDAVNWLEKFAEVAPSKAWLIFDDLQKVLFNYGNFGKIEDFYLNILKKAPGDVRTITALANFYERKGDLIQASNLVSDLIVTNPKSFIAKIAYSKIMIAQNRDREASDMLNDILYTFDSDGEIRCSNCGHVVHEALWICPVCGSVDTFLD
jgi:lipopolysaccharide biosynthesis regulator YciM